MSESNVQPATRRQAAAIRRLVTSSGINPIGLDWKRFVVALDGDGELIGCGQLKPDRDGSVELASIAVEEAWRQQGVASEIIERLIAKHDGDLYLMCRSPLKTFYERFGFRAIGKSEMPPYFRTISQVAGVLAALSSGRIYPLVMYRPGDADD